MECTITCGIGHQFQKDLKEFLETFGHIVVGFDGNLNKISQKQQTDLIVRFCNSVSNEVTTRYFSLVFLDSTVATKLREGLTDAIGDKNLIKLVQILMDGPAVNIRMLDDLKKGISEKYPDNPTLLDLDSCGLHNVHCSYKTGMKKTEWEIDNFLSCLYRLFKNIPPRRGNYTKITKSDIFPLKFFDIR